MAENTKKDITCIQISKQTRDKLADMGSKKDTFEDVVNKLIDFKKPTSDKSDTTDTVEEGN